MITVSVVIPAYNHAVFLGKAIQSVLAQTWPAFEIIVVDDGSKDETPAVVAQFGAAVRYIRQTNRGMAAARNVGIRHASGSLISFLDDDDIWLPNYLATVVPYFEKDPQLAAVYTGHRLTSDQEGRDYARESAYTVPALQLYTRLLEGGFFPPSGVSVRRTCLDTVGLFDETLHGCADWELWLRISREHKFIGIPEVLIKYRIHAGGLSSNVQHMTEDHLRAIHKHFGPPEGVATTWPPHKRVAYGFAHRSAALAYLQREALDMGWNLMQQAATIAPEILARLDTYYELACGNQPRGVRGQADLLDIDRNGAEMLQRLEPLLSQIHPTSKSVHRIAHGRAYLALAMLSDQSGRWSLARRYLWRAVMADPGLLTLLPVVRRLLKLTIARRPVEWWRGAMALKRTAGHRLPMAEKER